MFNVTIKELQQPVNIMINISESTLSALIPTRLDAIVENARKHLRRVYPRGSRIKSGNLDPSKFWRAGSHFTALNWQKFDLGMQLNEAMFCGTGGWVVKPESQRGLPKEIKRVRITVEIYGLSARKSSAAQLLLSAGIYALLIPVPQLKKDEELYLQARVHILHGGGEEELKSKSVKVHSKLIPEEGLDVIFDERFSAEIVDDGFTFVRYLFHTYRRPDNSIGSR